MKAHVGDRLIVDGEGDRVGLVIGVQHEDGTPPYVIKWLSDGHVALVFPGPYARIVPAGRSLGTPNHSVEAGAGVASNHVKDAGNHADDEPKRSSRETGHPADAGNDSVGSGNRAAGTDIHKKGLT